MASASLPALRRRSLGRSLARSLTAAAAVAVLGLLAPSAPARQEDVPNAVPAAEAPAEEAPEIAREREIAERFLSLLERNPRPGTALDRAYAFYAERGELAELADRLRSRMEEDEEDAAAPAILGLIEARRGNDDAAIAAFQAAAERAPEDPNPRARLAETLALAGRPVEAAAAYEAALARDPSRRDLPDLLSGLGRALTRGGQEEEASAVWDRLTEQFPGDDAVREQIAAVLEAEGNLDAALARYEALAAETDDDYRRIAFGLKAAGLKVRLGRTEDAVQDFEALLANLNPDSWLFREVRGGIERSFLRTDDLAGLTAYYEGWLKEHPEDVAAMARLGELLDRQNRDAEARRWLEKGVEKAPGDARLRRALIAQLLRAAEYAAAAEQFKTLDEQTPGDADTLRDWGSVLLSDPSRSDAERLAAAKAIWERLLEERGEDPVAVTRVADWLRQAGDDEGAKALYRRAAELASEDPRYREYLGEYLHVLGESEAAVAVWTELAAGENRGVKTLARLSEVLGGFGYDERAAAAAAEADALDVQEAGSADPTAGALEFADRMRFAELFSRAGRADAAEAQIAKAEALAVTLEERRAALNAAIDADKAADRLEDRIAELETQAEANPDSADAHLRLALYRDAVGDAARAAEAAERAATLSPRDVTALATLSELQERAGRLTDAIATARRLADMDRQRRADHLTRVAELQLRLGQRAEALRTAREVVAGAPGNPEGLAFLSRVAFRTGDEDAGFDALRRAARNATQDAGPLLALADALAERFRTDEAVELLWRAFAAVDGFDDKSIVVRRLATLAQRQGRFEQFLEKLERLASGGRGAGLGGGGIGGAGEGPDREAALLLAEAHLAVDDAASARATLEPLLARDPRDAPLLARLATLAESAGDLEDAIGFQRRVVELGDAPAERMRLAGLLTAAGNDAEAEPFFLELLGGQSDPAERVRAIDRLLAAGRQGVAVRLIDAGLARDGDDWELLSRLAIAAVSADDGELTSYPASLDVTPLRPLEETLNEESRKRIADAAFRRVWELSLPADAPSAAAQAAAERARSRRAGSTGRTATTPGGSPLPPELLRKNAVLAAMSRLGMLPSPSARAAQHPTFSPDEYGTARLLAASWLIARDDAFGSRVFADAAVVDDAEPDARPTERAVWDAYHLLTLGQSAGSLPREVQSDLNAVRRRLSNHLMRLPEAGRAEAVAYLNHLDSSHEWRVREDGAGLDALTGEEIGLLERAAEVLTAEERGAGVQFPYATRAEALLIAELERAGAGERVQARIDAIVGAAVEPEEMRQAATLLSGVSRPVSEGRSDTASRADADRRLSEGFATLLDRALALPAERQAAALPTSNVLAQLAAARTAAGDLPGAFRLLDLHAEAAAAAPPGAGSTPGASRGAVTGAAAMAGRRLPIWIPQENGRFTQYNSEAGFPPPALPIDDEQVALLRSQTMWLTQPDLLAPLRDEAEADLTDAPAEEDAPADATEAEAPAARVAPLVAHLKARVDAAEGVARKREVIRLACLEAWLGNVDEAVGALLAALALTPDDADLRRVVAAAQAERGDAAAGLALLDAVEPADPDELRERELLALRTAAGAANLDRARAAADRLFGLRLSNEEQIELARTMQRLGMGDKASAVLARMRQTAGNDAQTLTSLMDLHVRRGEEATAAEIARTVLSRFRPLNLPLNQGRTSAQQQAEAARKGAVKVLKELGELGPVLADLRAKLERNPNADSVRDELIALLNEAGREAEALALIRSDAPAGGSPAALAAAAQAAVGRSDHAAAADLYLRALKADPQAIGTDVGRVFQSFKQAGRAAELMTAVGETDPADWGPYRQLMAYLLQQGTNDADSKEAAFAAFESLWKDHPDIRDELFARADGNSLMGADGVYEYAVERLLTGAQAGGPAVSGRADWNSMAQMRGWSDGPITQLHRTLDAAKERDAIPALIARIEQEREADPDWAPGRMLLAAAHAAAGDAVAAREQVEALLALPEDERPPGMALWILSVELDRDEELADLALDLMRRVVESGASSPWSGNGWNYSPRSRLAELLIQTEKTAEARDLLVEQALNPQEETSPNRMVFRQNPRYLAQRSLQERATIGKRLATIGYPLDALRVLDAAGEDASRFGVSAGSWELRQLSEAVEEVRGKVTAEDVARQLTARLAADRAALAAGEPLAPGPTLDLFVSATDGGDEMQNAAIASSLIAALADGGKGADRRGAAASPFASPDAAAVAKVRAATPAAAVAAAPLTPATALVKVVGGLLAAAAPPAAVVEVNERVVEEANVPMEEGPAEDPAAREQAAREQAATLGELLAEAIELRPDDLSLHAASALLAFAADDVPAAQPSVAAALRLARAATADEGRDGTTAAPAPATVGTWWLVGAEALNHEATKEDGRALTEAALAAADPLPRTWQVALRVRAGQLALDRDDPAAAEAHWTALLGDLLERDLADDPAAAPPGEAGAALPPAREGGGFGVRGALLIAAVAVLDDVPDAPAEAAIPVTTGPRARRALRLAKLAAEKGLTDLSLRAVRETLGGGPPLGGGSGGGGSVAYVQSMQLGFSSGIVMPSGSGGGMFGGSVTAAAPGEDDQPLSDGEIAGALRELSQVWSKAEADPAAVAATLREVVLPAARPREAFVYVDANSNPSTTGTPTDAVTPLLEWTLKADATGALRDRLEERLADDAAGPEFDLLRVRLALATERPEDAAALLATMTADVTLSGDRLGGSFLLHAALPALEQNPASPEAAAALLAGAEAHSQGGDPRANYLQRLAQAAFARDETEAATDFLDRLVSQGRAQRQQSSQNEASALATAVQELAAGGAVAAALDRLSELKALPDGDYYSQTYDLDRLAADLAKGFDARPTAERYTALRDWTLPEDAERPGLVRGVEGRTSSDGEAPRLVGTAVTLAAAAAEAGRTADLAAALDRADAARAAAPPAEEPSAKEPPDGAVGENDLSAGAAAAIVVSDANRPRRAAPSGPAPPELDAMRSATLRLLADLPADVPGAFAAAAKVREWAAERLEQSNGWPNRARPAQRAIMANLLLAQTALERPEHRDAARAEFAALEQWASTHGRIGNESLSLIRALRKQADGAGAAAADEAATEAPVP